MLGYMAHAAGRRGQVRNTDVVPGTFQHDLPRLVSRDLRSRRLPWALWLPAAVMSIGAANLFHAQLLERPTSIRPSTPAGEAAVAKIVVSMLVKVGAFAVHRFSCQPNSPSTCKLLGGLWILQTFPVGGVLACSHAGFRAPALLAGWGRGDSSAARRSPYFEGLKTHPCPASGQRELRRFTPGCWRWWVNVLVALVANALLPTTDRSLAARIRSST